MYSLLPGVSTNQDGSIKMTDIQHTKKLPIGISDFRKIVEGGYYFIDKTLFISEIIESGSEIILIPRPRRFGKTLNLSMLRYFFERVEGDEFQEREKLFAGLNIRQSSGFLDYFAQHPVIFLTFKDVKDSNFAGAFYKIRSLIRVEYERHLPILEKSKMTAMEQRELEKFLLEESEQPLVENSLKILSGLLYNAYKVPPIILLDEYDTPVHASWVNGYYDEMINFTRNLLSGAFKDNSNIFKGIITGVLRVARESIFSGLNNLDVCTILDDHFSDKFGFTVDETQKLLEDFGLSRNFDEVNEWYNGYKFGDEIIFNPWSIINFTDRKKTRPYWANTSSNELLKGLVSTGNLSLRENIEKLIRGESIESEIDENIVFPDLKKSEKYIYSLLFFSGYLKSVEEKIIDDRLTCVLSIPNREVRYIYREIISFWLETGFENQKLKVMLKALVESNVDLFSRLLNEFVLTTLSYFDAKGKNPEAVFQAFILGMLLNLGLDYEISSNRELGYGRYDVLILPKDKKKTAVIMELKSITGFYEEEPEKAIHDALEQIESRGYGEELAAKGYGWILKLAVVSDGKKVWVREDVG